MDGFRPFDANIDPFHRLPTYKQEPLFPDECLFDDVGFGFDPSPSEHNMNMLGLYPDTTNSLSAVPTYPISLELPPSCLLRDGGASDLELAKPGQDSTRPGMAVAPPSGSGGASPWSGYEDAVVNRIIEPPPASRRKRERMMTATSSTNSTTTPLKTGVRQGGATTKVTSNPPMRRERRRRRMLSSDTSPTTSSSSSQNQKEQSLEKNRIAAAKCRTKKKEQNEQMLADLRTKATENKVLRDVIRRMKTELQIVTTFLLAYSDCAHCRKSEQFKDALKLVQHNGEAAAVTATVTTDTSESRSLDGSLSPVDNPGLSWSPSSPEKSGGSTDSYGPSLEEEVEEGATCFDAFMIGDGNGEVETRSPPSYSEMVVDAY